MTVDEHISKLQKEVFELKKELQVIKQHQDTIENQLQKDVKEMRVEAEKVLEKASALVNPYSTKAMTYDKHKKQI